MIDVALETGEDRRKMVRTAVEALGDAFFSRVREAESILLKVNLVHHEKQLASTHIDAVRGVLDAIRAIGSVKVYVGDASYHGTKAALRNLGYERLLTEYQRVELVDLNYDDHVEGYSITKDGSKNTIRRSKLASDVDMRISLAPMKMHADVGIAGSVKSWTVGTWVVPPRISGIGRVWARWPWMHEEGPRAHHQSIMELYRQLPCDIGIVDGVLAMEGDGPTRGTAVPMGVVIAGAGAVAVDAVAATLMGVDPADVGYLAMCAEAGLGVIDLARINVPPMVMMELRREFARPLKFDQTVNAWKQVS